MDLQMWQMSSYDPDNAIFGYKSSDFESIYLFFDYDFYKGDLDKKNDEVLELLEYFNEETENGKLFISYPMIESIQYTKELLDGRTMDALFKTLIQSCCEKILRQRCS